MDENLPQLPVRVVESFIEALAEVCEVRMDVGVTPQYDSNAACPHCQGIIRHAAWCIKINRNVYYAFRLVFEPDAMTPQDKLALRGMSVRWEHNV